MGKIPKTFQNYEFVPSVSKKQKSIQLSKYGKSELPYYAKSIGKHKQRKAMGFLPFSHEAEIHTIPKTWKKLIPIVREKHGKNKSPCIPKLKVSYIFRVKQKSRQSPNHGTNEFPSYETSMGKHRQFPNSALPHRFWVSGNPCNLQCLRMYKFP